LWRIYGGVLEMKNILWLLLLLMISASGQAKQFRQIVPVLIPDEMGKEELLNQLHYAQLPVFDRNNITEAVAQITAAWAVEELGDWLSKDFINRQQLLATLTLDVPRDARIRIMGLRGQRVVSQQISTVEKGILRKTKAIALVRTQIEFTDPSHGFQRLTGELEFMLQFTEHFE